MKAHSTLQLSVPEKLGPLTTEEAALFEKLDLSLLPRHAAIIMDGNGRWAQRKHLPRIAGHRAGSQTARTIIETCSRLNLEVLTLYAFSVENWRRPKTETDFLMALLREYLRRELPLLQRNNIRLRFLGRLSELPANVQRDVNSAMQETSRNSGMVLCLALNYGGRAEIVDAVNAILQETNGTPRQVNEEELSRRMYTNDLPDPDLLVRTSGEMRISNFLLWQIAYAEILVTETLWPDFNRARLFEAFLEYQKRERRYGGIREGGPPAQNPAKIASR